MRRYDESEPINVGVGEDVPIRELAVLIGQVVGYDGAVGWDRAKPDGGMPRKLLDVSRLKVVGWKARIGLKEGLERTYAWYVKEQKNPNDVARL